MPGTSIGYESKDGRRVWSITDRGAGTRADMRFDVNGVRQGDFGWEIAGHNHFFDLEAAEDFCRGICGEGARRLVATDGQHDRGGSAVALGTRTRLAAAG